MLALLAVGWFVLSAEPRWEGDTFVLHAGLVSFLRWMSGSTVETPAKFGGFAIFQYLTGLPIELLARAGLGVEIVRFWSLCSTVSLFGLVWLFVRRLPDVVPAGRWLLVIVLLTGLPLAYGASTFNELPATFLTAAFVAMVASRSNLAATAFVAFLAALTKDTAAPLLVVLWIGALLTRARQDRRWGANTVAMAISMLAALTLHAAFNHLRFGTFTNAHYLRYAGELNAGALAWLDNIAALWLAPNGGLLPFWPAFVVLLIPLFTLRRLAGVLAFGLLGFVTVSLAAWPVPFGWWCWGPRLLLPWLPAILLLTIYAEPGRLSSLAVTLLRSRVVFIPLTVLLPFQAIPHAAALHNDSYVTAFFSQPEPPTMNDATAAGQHERIHFQAWQKRPWLWLRPFGNPATIPLVKLGVYLAGVSLLLVHARSLAITCTTTSPEQSPLSAPSPRPETGQSPPATDRS